MEIPVNTTALAYIGDAVYELYIRKHIIAAGQTNADAMHKMSVRYVSAEAQAKILKKILGGLSVEEQDLVKRARNHKISTKPKNTGPVTYKLATAFEALVGYHFLAENEERLLEIMKLAVSAAENTGGKDEQSG